jgi:hypothetical protein
MHKIHSNWRLWDILKYCYSPPFISSIITMNNHTPLSGDKGFISRQGRRMDIFSSPPHPDRLWDPPSLLTNMHQGLFSRERKGVGPEADHSPPYSVPVTAWSYTSIPHTSSSRGCLVKHRDFISTTAVKCVREHKLLSKVYGHSRGEVRWSLS